MRPDAEVSIGKGSRCTLAVRGFFLHGCNNKVTVLAKKDDKGLKKG